MIDNEIGPLIQPFPASPTKRLALLVIAISCLGLVAAAALIVFYFRDSSEISAYNSASTCASPMDALSCKACRYVGQAIVAGTGRTDQLETGVVFDSLPERVFRTSLLSCDEPPPAAYASAEATLWDGRITKIGRCPTVNDPHGLATATQLEFASLFGVFGLAGILVGGLLARQAWRNA